MNKRLPRLMVTIFVIATSRHALSQVQGVMQAGIQLTEITITEVGTDPLPKADQCNKFRMSKAEVAIFFAKARARKFITDEYSSLWEPRFIRGTGTLTQWFDNAAVWNQRVRWEIRSGGTANIWHPDGGSTTYEGKRQ